MKKNSHVQIKIYFLATLLLTAGILFVGTVSAAQPCRSDHRGHCVELAQTVIPGLEFLKLSENTLGELILSLYYFAFAIIGAATLIAMIYGGILYMTAGDNSSRASEGRKWLANAVTGLAVALVSWIILYTINPDLVTKLNLRLEPIKYVIKNPNPPVQSIKCKTGTNPDGSFICAAQIFASMNICLTMCTTGCVPASSCGSEAADHVCVTRTLSPAQCIGPITLTACKALGAQCKGGCPFYPYKCDITAP